MNDLYEITGRLLAAFAVALLAYLTPKVKAWFTAHTDATTQENIRKLVQSFARAAEQLYHDNDSSGEKRQQFVQEQLRAMGVAVTEAVINMIEGAVWEINTENKKALVQIKEIVSEVGSSKIMINEDSVRFTMPGMPHTTVQGDSIQSGGTIGVGPASVCDGPVTT